MTVEHRDAPGFDDLEIEFADDDTRPTLRLRETPEDDAPQPQPAARRILDILAEAETPLAQARIRKRAALRNATVTDALHQPRPRRPRRADRRRALPQPLPRPPPARDTSAGRSRCRSPGPQPQALTGNGNGPRGRTRNAAPLRFHRVERSGPVAASLAIRPRMHSVAATAAGHPKGRSVAEEPVGVLCSSVRSSPR